MGTLQVFWLRSHFGEKKMVLLLFALHGWGCNPLEFQNDKSNILTRPGIDAFDSDAPSHTCRVSAKGFVQQLWRTSPMSRIHRL